MITARTLPFPMFRRSAGKGFGQLAAYAWRIMSTRHGLADLDERMLKDLGISRAQARFELARPIWKFMR